MSKVSNQCLYMNFAVKEIMKIVYDKMLTCISSRGESLITQIGDILHKSNPYFDIFRVVHMLLVRTIHSIVPKN